MTGFFCPFCRKLWGTVLTWPSPCHTGWLRTWSSEGSTSQREHRFNTLLPHCCARVLVRILQVYGYHGAIHMSKRTFGPDADTFRPERFIDSQGKFKLHEHILASFFKQLLCVYSFFTMSSQVQSILAVITCTCSLQIHFLTIPLTVLRHWKPSLRWRNSCAGRAVPLFRLTSPELQVYCRNAFFWKTKI